MIEVKVTETIIYTKQFTRQETIEALAKAKYSYAWPSHVREFDRMRDDELATTMELAAPAAVEEALQSWGEVTGTTCQARSI